MQLTNPRPFIQAEVVVVAQVVVVGVADGTWTVLKTMVVDDNGDNEINDHDVGGGGGGGNAVADDEDDRT